jgi:hypothetical protein
MFRLLMGIKIILYALVFVRAFQKTPIGFLIALALLTSGFWRSFYKYTRNKKNWDTLTFS